MRLQSSGRPAGLVEEVLCDIKKALHRRTQAVTACQERDSQAEPPPMAQHLQNRGTSTVGQVAAAELADLEETVCARRTEGLAGRQEAWPESAATA